ncbi:hypothetical protein B0J14DRAFT_490324 [Halenospora varia]|nr:hypothetical protein B0J14DRAFT_490324 [Halenospora varia]
MVVATALIVSEIHAPFQVTEVQLDALRSDEVSVELKATSICATDVAVQHGKIPLPFPIVVGHEGMSKGYLILSASCIKIDKSLDLCVMCSMGCGIQTGAGAVLNIVKPIERNVNSLAIFGIGAVGSAALMMAKVIAQDNPGKLEKIIVVDMDKERLELATEFGATNCINPRTDDVIAKIMELTNGEGVDAAVDCSGVLSVINSMIEVIGTGGIAVTVGNPPNGSKAAVEIFPFILGCKTYCASHQGNSYSKTFIPYLASLYKENRFPIDRLQKKYDAAKINEAISDMTSGTVIKPVLVWA